MAETLREYLVSLKFDVDRASEDTLHRAVRSGALQANLIAEAIASAAKAVGTLVQETAKQLDGLFYASQRTNASAANLKAFGYAASQMGSSVEAAAGSVENFARKLRETPGYEGMLKSLGINTRVNGQIRDSVDLLKDLGKVLATKKPYQAMQYFSALGIDEKTAFALMRGVDKYTDDYKRKMRAAGLDPETAAKSAQSFMQAWRDIFATLEVIVDSTMAKIMGDGKGGLTGFSNWFEKQTPEISSALANLADAFIKAFQGWSDGLGKINWKQAGKDAAEFGKSLASVIGSLATLVKMAGDHPIVAGALAGGLGGSRLGPYGAIVGALGGAFAGDYYGNGGKERLERRSQQMGQPQPGGSVGSWWRGTRLGNWWSRNMPSALGGDGASSGDGGGAWSGRAGDTGAVPMSKMMSYAMSQLRDEGVPEENLRAAAAHLVGQAYMESTLDPTKHHDNNTGYGIYGARLNRRDSMFKWLSENGYAKNSAEGQMRYMAHEAMSGMYPKTRNILMNANPGSLSAKTSTVTGEFERPAIINNRSGAVIRAYRVGPEQDENNSPEAARAPIPFNPIGSAHAAPAFSQPKGSPFGSIRPLGSDAAGGSRGLSVGPQTTNIQVHGSADPVAIGAAVARQQARLHGDLVRNLSGSVA